MGLISTEARFARKASHAPPRRRRAGSGGGDATDACRTSERLTTAQKVKSSRERDRPVRKRLFRQRAGGAPELFVLGVRSVSDFGTCPRASGCKKRWRFAGTSEA